MFLCAQLRPHRPAPPPNRPLRLRFFTYVVWRTTALFRRLSHTLSKRKFAMLHPRAMCIEDIPNIMLMPEFQKFRTNPLLTFTLLGHPGEGNCKMPKIDVDITSATTEEIAAVLADFGITGLQSFRKVRQAAHPSFVIEPTAL